MPDGILESLISLIDHNSHRNEPDYSYTIFVFLSNTAGIDISLRLGDIMQSGTLREKTKMTDFEKILKVATSNLNEGMKSLIEAHVVDHYIPFLPLEKAQVYQCLEAEFKRWNKNPDPDVIEDIIKYSVSFERKTEVKK